MSWEEWYLDTNYVVAFLFKDSWGTDLSLIILFLKNSPNEDFCLLKISKSLREGYLKMLKKQKNPE